MLPALAAFGSAAQGISGLVGSGKRRRAAKKARKEQLRLLRDDLSAFDKDAPRQRVRLGELQQGLEGGLANERMKNLKSEQARMRDRLMTAIKQAKRNKKAENSAMRMDVLGDMFGSLASGASGLSSLFGSPPIPVGEQVGMGFGSAMGAPFGPLGVMQGLAGGQRYARRQGLMKSAGY